MPDGQVGVVFAAGNGTCESRLKVIASDLGMLCCSLANLAIIIVGRKTRSLET